MAGAGGISNGGTATINASQVDGNTAPGAAGGGILNHGVMTINGSKVTGNTPPPTARAIRASAAASPTSTSARRPRRRQRRHLDHHLQPDQPQHRLRARRRDHRGHHHSDFGPAAGGPLTIKFSQVTGNKAADGGGIFAVPGSPVTLKFTVVAKNIPDNCAPPAASRAVRTENPLPARNRQLLPDSGPEASDGWPGYKEWRR